LYKGGVRPRGNQQSMHCAVHPKHIEQFKENWGALDVAFSVAADGN
jgi:hypothetical protein